MAIFGGRGRSRLNHLDVQNVDQEDGMKIRRQANRGDTENTPTRRAVVAHRLPVILKGYGRWPQSCDGSGSYTYEVHLPTISERAAMLRPNN